MIEKTDKYCYFSEYEIFREIYLLCGSSLVPAKGFYDFPTPFLKDSQIIAINSSGKVASTYIILDLLDSRSKMRRRRRRRVNLIQDVDGRGSSEWEMDYVRDVYREFISTRDSNVDALRAYLTTSSEQPVRNLVKNSPIFVPHVLEASSVKCITIEEEFKYSFGPNSLYFQNGDQRAPITMNLDGQKYIIPPSSSFICGDISVYGHLIKSGRKFDILICDPPWPNKSVKRMKLYNWLELDDIKAINVPELLTQSGLFCLWVPNNKRIFDYISAAITNHWGLTIIGDWFWLKVCKSGEPVCQFLPHHKKPYERIIFACHKEHASNTSSFPPSYTMISVPNANPSKKPPLKVLLEKFGLIKNGVQCLELFARYLLPNVTSIGNEVVKFQDEYYFEHV